MKRTITNKINYFLDNWIPSRVRDSKLLMGLAFRIVFGSKYRYYMDFKEKVPSLSEEEINEYYEILADTFIKIKTDLNDKCIEIIINSVVGTDILDAAAGKGYLIGQIQRKRHDLNKKCLSAVDIVLPKKKVEGIKFYQASLTKLPFENNSFDTVICTHALEHMKDAHSALNELRRVCRKRLIIVIPKQREYKYTFDLHINFFNYKYDVYKFMDSKNVNVFEVDHDWLCIEDY